MSNTDEKMKEFFDNLVQSSQEERINFLINNTIESCEYLEIPVELMVHVFNDYLAFAKNESPQDNKDQTCH